MKQTHTVFFIGKPGCGKGTQAKLLAQRTGWTIISAGEQFRKIAAEDTPVGNKIRLEMNAGDLAPHWFAMYLYLKSLFALGADANVIFDGFNRKVPEAELVIDSLLWLGRPFKIIHLAVSDDIVHKRLEGRKEMEGRPDDDAVDERLKEFYEHTEPALKLFRDTGVLIEIDGEQEEAKIAADVQTAIGI